MKKLLLLILLIPITTNAETIYSEYTKFISESPSSILTNDLISEEKTYGYIHDQVSRVNSNYYIEGQEPVNYNVVDKDDYSIISRNAYYLQRDGDISGAVNYLDYDGEYYIKDIEVLFFNGTSKDIQVFDINTNQKIPSTINNNILSLDKEYRISDIYFMINIAGGQQISLKIMEELYDICIPIYDQYYEYYITQNPNKFLESIGVYTHGNLNYFEYYVKHKFAYRYYEDITYEIENQNKENAKRIITRYNYYKRDKVIFNDYLEVNNNNHNLYSYIKESTIKIDSIKYNTEINYNLNGVYKVTYNIFNKEIDKYVYVLNENNNSNTCEFEYQESFTCNPEIVYVEYPVIYEKEITKFKNINLVNKCNTEDQVTIKSKLSSSIITFIMLFIPLIIKLRKRIRSFVESVFNH